MVSAMYFH